MTTDKIEIGTGPKGTTLTGRRPHKEAPHGPVPAPKNPKQILHLSGPQTKKNDFPPARLLALIPLFPLLSPFWRRQSRLGQKRPTKRGREKNKTKASKRGHIRIQTNPFTPGPSIGRARIPTPRQGPLYKGLASEGWDYKPFD